MIAATAMSFSLIANALRLESIAYIASVVICCVEKRK